MEKTFRFPISNFIAPILALCLFSASLSAQIVYSHNFNTAPYNHPYTVAPAIYGSNLTTPTEWTNTTGGWTFSPGSGGSNALSIASVPSTGSPRCTLIITVSPGYTLNVTHYNFWRRRASNGPSTCNITINGITIGSAIAIPTTGASTGSTAVSNPVSGLTGTVTVLISLVGSTGGSFRLDDFELSGSIGCTAPVASTTVTDASGTLANDGVICNGASATITASGGGTYAWSTGATTASINVNPSTTTTYTVTVTAGGGCTTTASTTPTITVNPLPTPGISSVESSGTTPNDGIICTGASATLTATGGTSYAWSTGGSGASIMVSPTATTTYTVTATDGNGCLGTGTYTVTVNSLPTASIAVTETSGNTPNDGVLCAGASATLTASGGVSYLWSTSAVTNPITVNTTGTYTVTVTNANGCTSVTSTSITVNPLPTASIAVTETSGTVNNDGTICMGASATLTASGGSAYLWSTTATTAAITASAAGTYTVTVTNANGCTSVTSTVLTVTALPSPSISIAETSGTVNNDGIICTGASVDLTASGGTSYAWSNMTAGATISVMPATTTTYTVTVTNANNCTASASVTITVNSLPSASISVVESSGSFANDGILCNGASATLTANGGTGYLWSTTATTAAISASTSGSYTVTVTNANGCTSVTSTTITVHPLPTPSIVVTETSGTPNDGTICMGASATLTAGGGASYAWSTGGAVAGISVSPATTTSYTVTVTDGNGCTATTSTTITVNAVGTVSLARTPNTPVCSGASVMLSATPTGQTDYTWTLAGSTGTTPSVTVNPTATFTYTVTVTFTGSCTNTASTTVTVNSLTAGSIGNDQVVCSGGDPAALMQATAATAPGGGTLTYRWESSTASCSAGFSTIGGATGLSYDPPTGLTVTTYYRRVAISTLSGVPCEANSNCVTVTVNSVMPGSIGADQGVCAGGDPAAFTELTPAAGGGTLTYRWESNTTGCASGFAPIGGATSATYDPPSGLTTTTYYRRVAISTLSGVPCEIAGNCVKVTVNNVTAGTVSGSQSVCSGGDPVAFTTTTGATTTGIVGYQWQSSTTDCSTGFTDIGGATGATYDPPSGLTMTTYYHLVVSSTVGANTCTATSNCLTVTVNALPQGGLTGSTICAGGTGTLKFTATAGTGPYTVVYTDGVNTNTATGVVSGVAFNAVPNPTSSDKTYTLVSVTGSGCTRTTGFDGSSATIYVNNLSGGEIAMSQTVCTGGDPLAFTSTTDAAPASGGSTPTYRWESSTTSCSAGWTTIMGETDPTYDPPTGITTTTYYRRVASSSLNDVSCEAASNCVTVTVPSNSSLTLTAEADMTTATCGNTITVKVKTSGTADIASLSYSLNWNPAKLQYVGYTAAPIGSDAPAVNFANALAGGEFGYTWSDMDFGGEMLGAGAYILTLTFNVISGTGSAAISITGVPAAIEASTSNYCAFTPAAAMPFPSIAFSDAVPPTATCSAIPITATIDGSNNGGGTCSRTVTGTDVTASDNCSFTIAYALTGATTGAGTGQLPGSQLFNVGTTSLTYTVSDGINSSACTYTVVITSSLPSATITASSAVCSASVGNTATATTGTLYNWSITGGTIVGLATINPISYTADASGTVMLSVTVTDGNGCTAVATKSVTINPLPTATITGTMTVCEGSTNTVSVPGAGVGASYNWSISNGTINSMMPYGASISYTAGTSGAVTLNVTVTDAIGCSSTGNKSVTINPLPDQNITVATAVCSGSTMNMASVPSAGMGATYVWGIDNGTITSGQGTTSLQFTAGTYTGVPPDEVTLYVTITDAAGCSNDNLQGVTINPLPGTTITTPMAACANSTGNTASVPTAVAAATYTWSITGGTITAGDGTTSITYTAGASGTLTLNVTVTDGNGCSNTGTKAVTIHANPTPTITVADESGTTDDDGILCTGDMATLNAGTYAAYGWSTLESSQTIDVSTAAIYTVTVTDANGCKGTDEQEIVVNTLPDPTITANAACSNAAGNTASVPDAGMGATYAWSLTNGTITSIPPYGASITYTAGASGSVSLFVTVTNSNGCSDDGLAGATIKPVPLLQTVLNGVTVTTNNDGTDDTGSFSVCNTANNLSFGPFTDVNATPGVIRVYQTVSYTNATASFCNNCSALIGAFTGNGTVSLVDPTMPGQMVIRFRAWVDEPSVNDLLDPTECAGDWVQYTVTIRPRPTGVITGTATICNGGSTTLNIAVTGSGPISGTLSPSGTFSGIAPNITVSVSPTMNTTYTIATLTDQNCDAIAADLTGSAIVTVNPRPKLTATVNTVTVTSNNDGTADNGSFTICNAASGNLSFTAFSDMNNAMPSTSVKVVQQVSSVNNVTLGFGNGVFPLSAYPVPFPQSATLVNPVMGGSFVMSFQAFFDADNDDILDVDECASDAVTYTVTVHPRPTGVITGTATICNGGSTTLNIAVTGSDPISGTLSPSGTFSGIAPNITVSVSPMTNTTYTIATLTDAHCDAIAADLTGSAVVTLNNVTASVVGADQTVCSGGDPAAFTVTTPATGSGALSYQWQSSTTAGCSTGFSDIALATSDTYDAPSGLTTTTYYRVVVTSTLNGVSCTATSNCVAVTVNDVTASGIGTDQTICSGGDPAAFTVTTPATGSWTLSYQWQSSTTAGCSTGFSDIALATDPAYDAPSGLTTTTYYRVVVTSTLNGVSCTATSSCVTVTVNDVTASVVGADQAICSGGDPAAFTVTTPATGSGTLSYQWQSSTTAGCTTGFSDIALATNATYDPPSGLTTTTYYRVVVTSTLNGKSCTATSNCITVTVNALPSFGFTATVAGRPSQSGNNTGGPTTVTLNFCAGESFTFSGFSSMPSGQVGFETSYTTSGNVTYGGGGNIGVSGGSPISAGGAAGFFAGTYGSYGLDAGTSGWITQIYTPYNDVNMNGSYDPGIDCQGTPMTLQYNIYALPDVIAMPSSQMICSGQTTSIALSSAVAGTTFAWVVQGPPPVTVTGWADGSGASIAQTLVNTGMSDATVTYRVTPTGPAPNNCVGAFFDVVVTVKAKPAITCPSAMTAVTSDGGTGDCLAAKMLTHPTPTGNCTPITLAIAFSNGTPVPGSLPLTGGTVTAGGLDSYNFATGQTSVTYTATDNANNTTSCAFTVTVTDDEKPSITCPANTTLAVGSDCSVALGSWAALTVSDNCTATASITVTQSPVSTTVLSGHNTPQTVTLTATDAASNATDCMFVVTLKDVSAPVLTCPADQTLSAADGLCTQDYTIADPIADNCMGATWGYSGTGATALSPVTGIADGMGSSPITFNKGTTTVTLSGVDAATNAATACSFSVIVNDNQAPVLTCPANQTITTSNNGTMDCTGGYTIADPVSDNCTGATWGYAGVGATTLSLSGIADGTGSGLLSFSKGLTTVTLSATDGANTATTCAFTVLVNDDEMPIAVCAPSITVTLAGGTASITTAQVNNGSSDNCTAPGDLTLSLNTTTLTCADIEAASPTVVAYSGTITTGNQTYTENLGMVFTVVSPIKVTALGAFDDGQNGLSRPIQVGIVREADGMVVAGPITMNGAFDPLEANHRMRDIAPIMLPPGVYHIVALGYGAGEQNGNGNPSGPFTTTNGNGGLITFTGSSYGGTSFGLPASAFGIPNVFHAGTFKYRSAAAPSVNVTLTVKDNNGNMATCMSAVTVVDNTPPTITTCPTGPIGRDVDPDKCYASDVELSGAVASDNCGPVRLVYSPASGSIFPVGTTTVTVTAYDYSCNSNTSACTFNVIVTDNLVPVITCPANTTITANTNQDVAGDCATTVSGTDRIATDNCPSFTMAYVLTGATTASGSGQVPVGQLFSKGTTVVTYTATDGDGVGSATCSLTVVVSDNEAPTVTCPSSTTVNPDAGDCAYTGTAALNPTYNDNCSGATISNNFNNGSTLVGAKFPSGTTMVTWTVTDAAGNPGTQTACTFSVTVNMCVAISGKIFWKTFDCDVPAPTTTGVGMTSMALTGAGTDTDLTGADGRYNLVFSATGSYTVTPTKNINITNGLTSADATRVQQHASGTLLITDPYMLIAADVNRSNSVTTLDATLINQVLVGNPSALGIFNKSWRFVPKTSILVNPPWGFPEKITLSATAGTPVTGQDFWGIKLGDVICGFANPASKPSFVPVQWMVQDRVLSAGEEFTAEFRVNNFEDIYSYQFGLNFDPTLLQWLDVQAGQALPMTVQENFGAYEAANGELRTVWASDQGTSLSSGTRVFRVKFRALESGMKLSEVLRLSQSENLLPTAFKSDFQPVPVVLVFTETSASQEVNGLSGQLKLMQNRPNPVFDETTIGFELPEGCDARLRILDAMGRVIAERKATYSTGYHEERFQVGNMHSQGVLYYELTTPYGSLSSKMVVVKR